jgi:chemotaxis protein MotB
MIKAILGLKKKLGPGMEHDEGRPHEASAWGAHEPAHDDESNWLVSYADMMTLLCGFFIMLFSMAKLDEPKFEKVKEAVAEHFGGQYHSPDRDLSKWVTQLLQDTPLKGEASVEVIEGGVAISFKSQVFFDTLSAEVTQTGKRVLLELAKALREREASEKRPFRFVIEGHTDARPILSGSFPTNWELSSARAARVVRVFLERGFEPQKMAALGYADTRPLKPSRLRSGEWDESALSENRRVVVRVFHDREQELPTQVALAGEAAAAAPLERTPAAVPPKGTIGPELDEARRSAEKIRKAHQQPVSAAPHPRND